MRRSISFFCSWHRKSASAVQLKALARIARLLRDREVTAGLRSEVSPEKVYELLRRKVPGQAE